MAVVRLSTAARNAAVAAIAALFDAGAGAATLKIFSGAVPANGDSEGTGLLATVNLADPAFGSPVTGSVAATDPPAIVASATGTAASFVVEDSTGANVLVGDVSVTGGGGALQLATTALGAGGTVDITGFSLTMPAGA